MFNKFELTQFDRVHGLELGLLKCSASTLGANYYEEVVEYKTKSVYSCTAKNEFWAYFTPVYFGGCI